MSQTKRPEKPSQAQRRSRRPLARDAEGRSVSKYSPAIVDEILARLASGESLTRICRDDHMPTIYSVFNWLNDSEKADFLMRYNTAREFQADVLAEEILEIADDGTNDWMEAAPEESKTGWKFNGEHSSRSRLRVDTRKWYVGKVRPNRWGDRLAMVGGGPNDPPIRVETNDVTDRERAKAIAFLIAKQSADADKDD